MIIMLYGYLNIIEKVPNLLVQSYATDVYVRLQPFVAVGPTITDDYDHTDATA